MLTVNRINNLNYTYPNNNVYFQSKFVPTKTLKKGFEYASSNPAFDGRNFLKVMNKILNDGKNDLYRIDNKKTNRLFDFISTDVFKNDEKIIQIPINDSKDVGHSVTSALFEIYNQSHSKTTDKFEPLFEYHQLDSDEYKVVQKTLDNFAVKLKSSGKPDVLLNAQTLVSDAKQALDAYIVRNLAVLKEKIFR